MGAIRYILIAILVALYAIFGIPDWIRDGDYLTRAITYSFFHASIWHLAVNSLAIWGIFRKDNLCKACRDLAVSYIIAVLVFPFSIRPVIGFSNILYAIIGLRTPPLSSKWWRTTPVIVFLIVTVAMLFIPRFSATTHIAAFILGIACAYVRRFNQSLVRDARRYL